MYIMQYNNINSIHEHLPKKKKEKEKKVEMTDV